MQEKFILFLNAKDMQQPSWVVLNEDHSVREVSRADQPDGFAQIAENKTVIVLVPSQDVLLALTTMPKMPRNKLIQALPYAMEEQLIPDVENLHFAAGHYVADTQLNVAVITHEKMQAWLALLQTWQIKPEQLLPATVAVPYQENTWQICLLDDTAMVKTNHYASFDCDRQNLIEYIHIALSSCEKMPEKIVIHNDTSHAFAGALNVTMPVEEEFMTKEAMLSLLAKHVSDEPIINLLQGPYAVKKSHLPQIGKVWRLTTYFALSWIALLFLYPIIANLILGARVSKMDQQIALIYHRQFPQSKSVIAPKIRMQDKLEKLSNAMGDNRFLTLLGIIGKALQTANNITLTRMDFQNNQLTLQLTAGSSDDFSAFTDYLSQQGLSVKQQNANLNGARINATLQIDRG